MSGIHYLFVRGESCLARVLLNGFPIVDLDTTTIVRSTAPMVNPLLIGRDNELTVTLWPLPPAETGRLPPALVEGSLRKFKLTDPWAEPSAGEAVMTIRIPEPLRELGQKGDAHLPLSLLKVRFDSDGPSFLGRLLEAEVIDDRQRILDYGMRLRGLLAARDCGGMVRELAPKMSDYAEAYSGSEEQLREHCVDWLRDKIFARGVILDFGVDDLEVTPWCGGRIWRLRRRPCEPLLRTHPDASGLDAFLEVFVGSVAGELRIVR